MTLQHNPYNPYVYNPINLLIKVFNKVFVYIIYPAWSHDGLIFSPCMKTHENPSGPRQSLRFPVALAQPIPFRLDQLSDISTAFYSILLLTSVAWDIVTLYSCIDLLIVVAIIVGNNIGI